MRSLLVLLFLEGSIAPCFSPSIENFPSESEINFTSSQSEPVTSSDQAYGYSPEARFAIFFINLTVGSFALRIENLESKEDTINKIVNLQ